jgi:hypothetical protein
MGFHVSRRFCESAIHHGQSRGNLMLVDVSAHKLLPVLRAHGSGKHQQPRHHHQREGGPAMAEKLFEKRAQYPPLRGLLHRLSLNSRVREIAR